MSDLPANTESENDGESFPSQPGGKMKSLLQELEIMSLQKRREGALSLGEFNSGQKDRILDLMARNEDNSLKFHTDRTDAIKEIELAKIKSANTNNTTIRIVLLGILAVFSILTIVILLFKDQYFSTWIAFVTGMMGGAGVTKGFSTINNKEDKGNAIVDDSDD